MIKARWSFDSKGIFGGADASIVAEEISEISESPTPKEVVEYAKNENTELHKCFEWDDKKAAEHYRVVQARQVLRSIVIVREDMPEDTPPIRLFYKTFDREGYKKIDFILQNEDEYEALLERAKQELKAFRRKYSMLKELNTLFDMIDHDRL